MILYIYSLFIQSYLISLILTHSTLSAVSLICPFVKRAQTSFLPLFYQLSTAWIVRINRYQLLCGGFRFLPFFPSLRSTQFNASTRFPTCLRTFKSTKQAALVLSSRMSMDGQAVLQYISHTPCSGLRPESFPPPDFSGISHCISLWCQVAIRLKSKQKQSTHYN